MGAAGKPCVFPGDYPGSSDLRSQPGAQTARLGELWHVPPQFTRVEELIMGWARGWGPVWALLPCLSVGGLGGGRLGADPRLHRRCPRHSSEGQGWAGTTRGLTHVR